MLISVLNHTQVVQVQVRRPRVSFLSGERATRDVVVDDDLWANTILIVLRLLLPLPLAPALLLLRMMVCYYNNERWVHHQAASQPPHHSSCCSASLPISSAAALDVVVGHSQKKNEYTCNQGPRRIR